MLSVQIVWLRLGFCGGRQYCKAYLWMQISFVQMRRDNNEFVEVSWSSTLKISLKFDSPNVVFQMRLERFAKGFRRSYGRDALVGPTNIQTLAFRFSSIRARKKFRHHTSHRCVQQEIPIFLRFIRCLVVCAFRCTIARSKMRCWKIYDWIGGGRRAEEN